VILILFLLFAISVNANVSVPIIRQNNTNVMLDLNGTVFASKEVNLQVPRRIWNAKIKKLPEDGALVKSGEVIIIIYSEDFEDRLIDLKKDMSDEIIDNQRTKFQQEISLFNLKNTAEDSKNSLDIEKLNLDMVMRGVDKRQLKIDKLGIDSLQQQIIFLNEQIKKEKKLFKKGFLSKIQLEEDELNLLNTKIDLELSKIDYDYESHRPGKFEKLKANFSFEKAESDYKENERELEFSKKSLESNEKNMEFSLKRLKNRIDRLKEVLKKCKIKASVSGIYIRPKSGWMELSVGRSIWSGMSLGKIVDSSQKIIKAKVYERDIENLRKGLSVNIHIQGSNKNYTGKISYIKNVKVFSFHVIEKLK
jgi:multidrug resistance efflux pump